MMHALGGVKKDILREVPIVLCAVNYHVLLASTWSHALQKVLPDAPIVLILYLKTPSIQAAEIRLELALGFAGLDF